MAKFEHESEASVVVNGGNSQLEVYSAKTSTTYERNKNKGNIYGHYTYGTSQNVESSRNWDLGLRFERELDKKLSLYLGQQAEGNKFNGIDKRYNSDIGVHYILSKSDKRRIFTELGYRYTIEKQLSGVDRNDSKGRVYIEGQEQQNQALFYRLWLEYIPNFSQSKDYLFNYEPSLNIVLGQNLSMKLGYKGMYDNLPVPGNKKYDYFYTLSLLARF